MDLPGDRASVGGTGPVDHTCRVLGVTRQHYYRTRRAPAPSTELRRQWLTGLIREVHVASLGTDGYRRVHAELILGMGITVTSTAPTPAPTTPSSRGYHIEDDYYGGTWARTATSDGAWHSRSNPPANGAYWYPNGLGVAVTCAVQGAQYHYLSGGGSYYGTWWARISDGKYVPVVTLQEVSMDGDQGLPHC